MLSCHLGLSSWNSEGIEQKKELKKSVGRHQVKIKKSCPIL